MEHTEYEALSIEVIRFETDDIITDSKTDSETFDN